MKDEGKLGMVDVAIIGAGVAGLSAAVFARLAGLSVRVFERHYIPGGLCTSWERKGYVFDYCVDWFMGTGKMHGAYPFWRELGLVDALEFRPIESFGRYVGADGRIFDLFTDPDRLEDEARSLSPGDLPRMRKFTKAVRKGRSFLMGEMSFAPRDLPYALKSMPAMLAMSAWSGVPVAGWCAGFRDPLLREGIPALVGEGVTMTGPIVAFGMMNAGNAAFPLGGSLRIAQAMEARARGLGADFAYRRGVKGIAFEGGKAVGLDLDDGGFQPCLRVIAACDVKETLYRLLGGRAISEAYDREFERGDIHKGLIQVSVGARLDPAWGLDSAPKNVNFSLARPIDVDGVLRTRIALQQTARDPSMAPLGCASFIVRFASDYDRWKALGLGTPGYAAEKARLLSETVEALDGFLPGFAGRVEASDVSTPLSCERYTGNYRGSFMGWQLTPRRMRDLMRGRRLPRTLDGARGVYLAGQWTVPGGGIPPSAMSGRDAVRAILRDCVKRVNIVAEESMVVEKINLAEKFASFSKHWDPKIIGALNGQHVKLVKFKGSFVWHHHDAEDELFLVLRGGFTMRFRDRSVALGEGELIIVPRGVEHCPEAKEEVQVLLFEPASTVNTGSAPDDLTVKAPEWI